MLHIVLYQPEIPPNTGNIIRLAANTGSALHLIRPLGFQLDDKRLRRAGLDYHEFARLGIWDSFDDFVASHPASRLLPFSTHHTKSYSSFIFRQGDALLFGPETQGLPETIRAKAPASQQLTLPMLPGNRSLNLSNTVAIAVYEAWRQIGFTGAIPLEKT
ncbi:MAG: tRNA (cytidine(34)-2'-O)-methyltransferase [Arenicellales bacterium]|jgi:tRNA (cytidine/uridine-2'-O-)-methyltransferase|nr:tRNA (uridine(34)/cytosine(34)/5-carboxymethylaminomethyluridine(34)-2'-O)-methyltransferase TrmL [Acidiferrobacteraceae bacterium]MDP6290265.1 tRNA (cytidine(34)-2'-O)-methyltransferase [Arenicellales bacterium]MDP6434849.1 tRNA (cytidine(34)-2'-O)-methyltransferase [Arenicellales bacterium]MDP6673014.1 tRNA (cytidine(34)-2'-O)-methyltransferase [Arenicellales bacterium]MDP6724096.1 tRNA (cytidine(34)-2'-O)-methyltransferase [Arenicellales bacterium]|tara:strand:+ start:2491 stop:2970 length:480 start_codon:yes stop_codon:yes gene_type:complete